MQAIVIWTQEWGFVQSEEKVSRMANGVEQCVWQS